MADSSQPVSLFTISSHRAFADALVAGLMRRTGREPLALARTLVLLPNNRGVRAVTDAFVRASGGALLLPRLVALGDVEMGERVGGALDPADDPLPPAVPAMARRIILARLVAEERVRTGAPVEAGEAVRLAGELARTLDQLLVEGVAPERLRAIELGPELSEHWRRSLDVLEIVLDRWPRELRRLNAIDEAVRRSTTLERLASRWTAMPPEGIVCAAGITDPAPAVAKLLRCVASLEQGLVVFAGLDLAMPPEEWDALGPHAPDPASGIGPRQIETHPQFHMKLLLDRIGAGRGEVAIWREGSERDATATRSRAIANAMTPAVFTGKWTKLDAAERRLTGVRLVQLATPAEEAQAIALALREVLETPGRTAALVTPDRALARRVAAHCARWGIEIDDSAGRPLAILPPGTLLLALAEAAAQRFAPLSLLTLLKHPLVRSGERRLVWLDGVRALDLALRGPRPAPGLDAIDAFLGQAERDWWASVKEMLCPLARLFDEPGALSATMAGLYETAAALCGDALWAGPAGRALAEFVAAVEEHAGAGPPVIAPGEVAPLLRTLLDEVAVRPPQGGHPRLSIYGLIEARLQSADLMVLGGLNEGVWPNRASPDPWLPPRVRAELALAGLERRVGIAAHDFAQSLGAPQVLVTRSRREGRSPALASRLWLRLEAMAGDRLERADTLRAWAAALDEPGEHRPASRPAPVPPVAARPRSISVTEVDRLKADPYAFYARRMLRLAALDTVDADPSAAWRGSAVHDILEQWWTQDGCVIGSLRPRALAMLADARTHAMMRALWQPRLMEAIDWVAAEVERGAAEGRRVLSAEGKGRIDIAGVTLTGRYDRVDRMPDGKLGIVDYKTGKPPSTAAVREGFSLQLGLLAVIAERGGFGEVTGEASAFEYWSMGKNRDGFGYVTTPVDSEGKRDRIATTDFAALAAHNFIEAAGRWLTGDDAFTAKLVPEYAPYAEYDQLMRRDEWYGRE